MIGQAVADLDMGYAMTVFDLAWAYMGVGAILASAFGYALWPAVVESFEGRKERLTVLWVAALWVVAVFVWPWALSEIRKLGDAEHMRKREEVKSGS